MSSITSNCSKTLTTILNGHSQTLEWGSPCFDLPSKSNCCHWGLGPSILKFSDMELNFSDELPMTPRAYLELLSAEQISLSDCF